MPCPCPDGVVDLPFLLHRWKMYLMYFYAVYGWPSLFFLLRCVDIDFIPFCVLGIPHGCDPLLFWRQKPFLLVVLQRRLIVIYHPFYT